MLESRSEHPLQETLWSIGFGAAAYFVLQNAFDSGGVAWWLGGLALGAVCVALLVNLLRSAPVLIVQHQGNTARVALDCRLSAEEVANLNRRLAEELEWPVGG